MLCTVGLHCAPPSCIVHHGEQAGPMSVRSGGRPQHFSFYDCQYRLCGFVRPTLCSTSWVPDYVVHHWPALLHLCMTFYTYVFLWKVSHLVHELFYIIGQVSCMVHDFLYISFPVKDVTSGAWLFTHILSCESCHVSSMTFIHISFPVKDITSGPSPFIHMLSCERCHIWSMTFYTYTFLWKVSHLVPDFVYICFPVKFITSGPSLFYAGVSTNLTKTMQYKPPIFRCPVVGVTS